jgi:hypothetical protein
MVASGWAWAYARYSLDYVPLETDALSDRQLGVNCSAMLAGLARIARRDRGLASLH